MTTEYPLTVPTPNVSTTCLKCKKLFYTEGVVIYQTPEAYRYRMPNDVKAGTHTCPQCAAKQETGGQTR